MYSEIFKQNRKCFLPHVLEAKNCSWIRAAHTMAIDVCARAKIVRYESQVR